MGQLLLAGARSGPRDFPRLHVKPDGRRGPLTGCMHTKTAGRSFGRTALRVGPPAALCSELMLFATRDEMRDATGAPRIAAHERRIPRRS